MKMIVFSSILVLAIAMVAFAGDHKHGANVYKTDASGVEHAVCACGHKLEVGENTIKFEYEGQTYYLCGEGCKAHFEESAQTVKEALEIQVAKAKAHEGLHGNVYKVDDEGNSTAKCACGMELKVDSETTSRSHGGHTYYLCSEQCAGMFDKMPDKVIGAMNKNIKSSGKEVSKSM